MCFAADARPPIRPISGAAVAKTDLVLTASDGNELAAFEATSAGDGPAVVVLPDVRGLYRFYEELAIRFAERGYDAVAIDYFGRTAGVSKRDASFDFWPEMEKTTFNGVRADTAAAVAHVRQGHPDRQVFTIGFCFGGSNSWHQAANGHGLSGAIGFYGHPNRTSPTGAVPAVDRVSDMECPILGLMGGADPSIPAEEVARFDAALETAGVPHEIVTYPDAPHSFFDRAFEEYVSESEDAWQRVLAFIGRYSQGE